MSPIAILGFSVLAYPIVMSVVWMVGGLHYYFRRERRGRVVEDPPPFDAPPVTVLIPCHNEGANVEDTVRSVVEQRYPAEIEIIAINDGSTDDTSERLESLATVVPNLRVIHLESNQGKAVALRVGTLASSSEYLVCVDGDAILDEYAVHWLVVHMVTGSRVGAVTGNPRIRNRSTLLGKLQVGEFSSVIGLVKRAQRAYGRVFTVSGVVSAFRRSAVEAVGYWSDTIVTDDIDITWRLQREHWDVRFEPRALCSILMPETMRGLWKQRLRWAVGGAQTVREHLGELLQWRRRRMWGVVLEYLLSSLWCYALLALAILFAVGFVFPLPQAIAVVWTGPSWASVLLATVCMAQFAVSLMIDRRYEPEAGRLYYWMVWYPFAYWLITFTTSLVGFAKVFALGQKPRERARWESPDRGIGVAAA
jgi:biofilm PGA synthesis N-glycosyltransferase PgaC